MKTTTHLFFLLTVLVSFLSCSQQRVENKSKIGFSQCCVDSWRDAMDMEIKREVEFHDELQLEIKNAGNDSEQQIRDIKELVSSGIDVLFISPNESEPLTRIIDSISALKIPVILLDRKTNSNSYTTYIGADNHEIGREAAKYAIKKLNSNIKAIELQLGMTITPAINRHKGFSTLLLEDPSNKIVSTIEDIYGLEELQEKFLEIYTSDSEVNLIYAHNDRLASFASQWIDEIDQKREVLIIGIDGLIGSDGGIQMVIDGRIDATLLYPTGGEEAIATALEIFQGNQVDKKITLSTSIIDRENARMYKLQGDKLLNQQADIERQKEMLYIQTESLQNQKRFSILLGLFSLSLLSLIGIIFHQLRKNKIVNSQLAMKNELISNQHQELEILSKATDEANKEKVEFFTNISHEFKTPLTLILAPTEDLIKNGKNFNDADKNQLFLIKKSAERMSRLIGQLMDFRKIDTGKIKLQLEEVELVSFIKEIMSVFINVKEAKNIDFKFIAQLKKSHVLADREMLDKVFFNLISNAFKFTADDGSIHVLLAESELDDQVVIKLSDNGRGMSKEHVEHAFERFYQGENYSAKGTGLGLSLSKKLIDLHKGTISVVSEKGIGSTFSIRLPRHLSVQDEMQVRPSGQKEFASSTYINLLESDVLESSDSVVDDSKLLEKAILIIEDNKDLVYFLTQKLSNQYRILSALNGEDGIQLAESNIPNLIICDLMLPGIGGNEVVKYLKENVMTSHIPIIMLTAKDNDEQKQLSFKQGVYDFISKPFNHELLMSKVDAVFQNLLTFKKYYGRELIYDIAKKKMNENERTLLHNFDSFVQKNYNNPNLNVDAVCKELAMSKVQLYRKVKAITGSTINEYIQSVRIETAKDLLSDTDLTHAEVAYRCGFSSSSYFSRNFKNATGKSPSEWKKSTAMSKV